MWNRAIVKRIDIELTSFCNISCPSCTREDPYVKNILNNKTLPLELIRKKFRRSDWMNVEAINFCGSIDEPISHPDIIDIIEFFLEWGVAVSISTNGSLRSEDWWRSLGERFSSISSRLSIIWGVDGIDNTSEIYRIGSKFEKVRRNWRAFNGAGGRSTWQFIVFDHNKHQLEELEKLAAEEGFVKTKVIYSVRESESYVKVSSIKKSNKPQDTLNTISPVYPVKPELDKISCRYLNAGYIFINHLAEVIPCCYINVSHLKHSSGNVFSADLNHKRYNEYWKSEGGSLATNLEHNEIVDVIEGDFFQGIVDSWETNPFEICINKCKKNRIHDMVHTDI